jgi:hypothetical protein
LAFSWKRVSPRGGTVDLTNGETVLTAGEQGNVDPKRLLDLLQQAGAGMRVASDHKIYAPALDGDSAALFTTARNLLANLGAS